MGDFPRRMVYTVTMQEKTAKHVIALTAENYWRLSLVADSVGSIASTGSRKGQPSPATLMLEIARGSVECYTLDCSPPV